MVKIKSAFPDRDNLWALGECSIKIRIKNLAARLNRPSRSVRLLFVLVHEFLLAGMTRGQPDTSPYSVIGLSRFHRSLARGTLCPNRDHVDALSQTATNDIIPVFAIGAELDVTMGINEKK